jgi:predicted enzyme related to lactoylglutathione lyase
MALIEDSMGAVLILLRATGGDPAAFEAGAGDWLWIDLITSESAPSTYFYGQLADYRLDTVQTDNDTTYSVFKNSGKPRAGLVQLTWDGVGANWLPYVKVDDVNKWIGQAKELGGALIVQ